MSGRRQNQHACKGDTPSEELTDDDLVGLGQFGEAAELRG